MTRWRPTENFGSYIVEVINGVSRGVITIVPLTQRTLSPIYEICLVFHFYFCNVDIECCLHFRHVDGRNREEIRTKPSRFKSSGQFAARQSRWWYRASIASSIGRYGAAALILNLDPQWGIWNRANPDRPTVLVTFRRWWQSRIRCISETPPARLRTW